MRDRTQGGPGSRSRLPGRGLLARAASPLVSLIALAGSAAPQERPGGGISLLDAVRMTLARQPEIKLQEQELRLREGSLQAEQGAFDVQLASSLTGARERAPLPAAERPPGISEARTDVYRYEVQASKLLRSGLVLAPGASLVQTQSNLSPITESRARVSFTLTQPLLLGRGSEFVAARETSAGFERDAAGWELRHSVSRSLLETAAAYWSYVASLRRLEVLGESEQRFAHMEKDAELLLQGREIAAVDIKQLGATVARRRIARIEAEQDVFEARLRLGLAAGVGVSEMLALGPPTDELPSPAGVPIPRDAAPLLLTARERRSDLHALQARERSASALAAAARIATRPQLDLVVDAGYAGRAERPGLRGFFEPLGRNVPGPSASASLVLGWPISRRSAFGRLVESQALAEQARIGAAELGRVIGMRVALAVNDLARSAERVAAAREASDLYRFAVDAERQRLQLGLSSVVDLITTEDRLNESLLEEVSARLDYARAVAALRFETGTLLNPAGSAQEIDLETLTRAPADRP